MDKRTLKFRGTALALMAVFTAFLFLIHTIVPSLGIFPSKGTGVMEAETKKQGYNPIRRGNRTKSGDERDFFEWSIAYDSHL